MAVAILTILFALSSSACAETKFIRLRNQTIATSDRPVSSPNTPTPRIAEPSATGLFLIQFDQTPIPAFREQLRVLGVQLLNYVPDDAFVARVEQTRLSQLRALPFVRWVGEYQAQHKLHNNVRAMVSSAPGSSIAVRLLLAPHAPIRDLAAVARGLQRVGRLTRTRFGTVIEGELRPGRLQLLAKSAAVLWIEPPAHHRLFDEVASKIVGGPGVNADSHGTTTQQLGFTGKNVVVGVADTGLNNGDSDSMHPDLAGRVDAFLFYPGLDNAADEFGHGTHVAGIVAGNGATGEADDNGFLYGLGVASEAHLVAQRVFDAAGNDHLPPLETLTRDAVRAGAVIGSNSWGDDTQGRYDLDAATFDALVRDADTEIPGDQPYILEFSAGNAGPSAQTIGSPAVAKNVIATGASENDRTDLFIYTDGIDAMADFSSRGSCEDGRIKPDVVAPGTWISSLQSASATADNAWLGIDDFYQYEGGTSQAGPHASGAAAVFVQYYRDTHGGSTPSPALVKAALINSADDMNDASGTDPVPNMDEGWGRVNLANMIGASRQFQFLDQSVVLTNTQAYETRVVVADSSEPFKVTLTYSDLPGFPAAIPSLVNDLDLEVVGPDGALYRGNQFNGGDSTPNPAQADHINNVEAVHLLIPGAGDYLVRVRAAHLVEDIHHETNIPPRQDFALVISGVLAPQNVGVVALDRSAYTAPSSIGIRLVDFDLAGKASVSVQARSSTETNGETIVLLPAGNFGAFTGAVATATGPATQDGRLEIQNGDRIQVLYQDAQPLGVREGDAAADLVPPTITGVSGVARFSRAVISWDTDEPANSVVRYGTDTHLNLVSSDRSLDTAHTITLSGLTAGVTNFFVVISSDAAGNTSTNDNGGKPFTVITSPAPTVLLVDQYLDPYGLYDIPVTTYTDALDQVGIGYDLWDVSQEGRTPTLEELKPYRVVMWRVPELVLAFTASDLKALVNYLNGGGGLFIASMELDSRLDENGFSGFRQNVLHVDSFTADTGVPSIIGVPNLSFTSGMQIDLDFSAYPDTGGVIPQDVSDTFVARPDAAPILFDPSSGQTVGVRFPPTGTDSPGRVVFFSFPLDAVPFDGEDPNNRPNLVRNIVSFLGSGVGGIGTIELDRSAYSIPAHALIEVADSDLAGRGQATITLATSTLTNAQSMALSETSTPGLFRGALALVAPTNSVAPGQIVVHDGDSVTVSYQDALPPRLIQAIASVDTAPPEITSVAAEPAYSEATVSWSTSEPADSLAQFGESRFLGRTAYDQGQVTAHQIQLTGLLPGRTYYFQVVSRDAAGNAATDNHLQRFYAFQTLMPLNPPFSDDMESGSTNWVVANDDLSSEFYVNASVWELGTPTNSLATASHSGKNAWGTNLRGQANDAANTSLVGPAIELSGGNVATLRFWHNYDFTDDGENEIVPETAVLSITTNNAASWTDLDSYDGTSSGWVPVTVDLTPYIGNVVRLGWSYAFFSLDAVEHPGWLLDDVSITITNIELGTIVITNSLFQATYHLKGPLELSGSGLGEVVSNAPGGTYVLEYGVVPFYNSPHNRTNLLTGTNSLVFNGTYSFTDINANGISDAWEQQFLGSVQTQHPPETDTDGDGFSDLAEFIAGTDPRNASSSLALEAPIVQPNGTVRLSWGSVSGRGYLVETSIDLVNWTPISDWQVGTGAPISLTLPPLHGAYMFRLQVRP